MSFNFSAISKTFEKFFKTITFRSVGKFFGKSIITFGIDNALDYLGKKLEKLGVPTVIKELLIWTIRIIGEMVLAWCLKKSIPLAIVSCCAFKLLKIIFFKLFPSLEEKKNNLLNWILSTCKEKYSLLKN